MSQQSVITMLVVAFICGMAVCTAIPSVIAFVWKQMDADGGMQRTACDNTHSVLRGLNR